MDRRCLLTDDWLPLLPSQEKIRLFSRDRRHRYHETLRQGSDCPERQFRWETVRNGWTDKPTLGHPVEVDQRSETSHAIRQEEIRGSVVRPRGLSCETRVSTHVKMSRVISKSRSFRVLPACHYWAGRDLEPEEAAHAWDVGSRENNMAALLSNIPLCLI